VRQQVSPGEHFRRGNARVLQIVVHRQNQVVLRGPDAAEQGLMLTVVAAEAHAVHPRIIGCRSLDHAPRPVLAAVFDQQDFERVGNSGKRGNKLVSNAGSVCSLR